MLRAHQAYLYSDQSGGSPVLDRGPCVGFSREIDQLPSILYYCNSQKLPAVGLGHYNHPQAFTQVDGSAGSGNVLQRAEDLSVDLAELGSVMVVR